MLLVKCKLSMFEAIWYVKLLKLCYTVSRGVWTIYLSTYQSTSRVQVLRVDYLVHKPTPVFLPKALQSVTPRNTEKCGVIVAWRCGLFSCSDQKNPQKKKQKTPTNLLRPHFPRHTAHYTHCVKARHLPVSCDQWRCPCWTALAPRTRRRCCCGSTGWPPGRRWTATTRCWAWSGAASPAAPRAPTCGSPCAGDTAPGRSGEIMVEKLIFQNGSLPGIHPLFTNRTIVAGRWCAYPCC